MIIRKLFKFEGAHVVRNCSSKLCKYSIHGHSYKVEVFLESKHLDNGQMVVDFGLLKTTIKEFIESFDHCWSYWNKESEDFKKSVHKNSARWVEMPCSPSAESYAVMFLFVLDKIIQNTEFNNGEKEVKVSSVRVHETETGYAEAFREDLKLVDYYLSDIKFSESIIEDWTIKDWQLQIMHDNKFINKNVEQQIK